MADFSLWIYVIVTLVGIIYASWSGYKEAKKTDPAVEFSAECLVISILRALPGIIAASGALAIIQISPENSVAVVEALLTAFFAGIGSDVVLKRSWRALVASSTGTAEAVAAPVLALRRRLIHLQFRR